MRRKQRQNPLLIVVFILLAVLLLGILLFTPDLGVKTDTCFRDPRTTENICINFYRTREVTPPNGTPR
jgi:hypothetical protein